MRADPAPPTTEDALGAARRFALPGPPVRAERIGSGHIHETFAVEIAAPGGPPRRYALQRVHTAVFPDPEALMENLGRVTAHLAAKLAGVADRSRRALAIVPERDGRSFHRDTVGGFWRCFRWIDGSVALDGFPSPSQAFEAARAFGAFVAALADLGGPPLAEVIPHFHDLPHRLSALEAALRDDPHRRAAEIAVDAESARRAAERLFRRLDAAGAAELPRRIVHNDCKVNNVLLDARSGEALCVIDLDTVMTGTVIADFGDLVRTAASTAAEDERDLDRVGFDRERFAALARGYLAGAGALLEAAELRALAFAGPRLALENAVRFLTDHVQGDRYFRIHRPAHNLDRARAQLRLAERMLEGVDGSDAIVRALAGEGPGELGTGG